MSNKTFQELHLGIFKADDSYKNCLKRVRNEPCGKIAEELHYAHKRNEAKDKSIAELEKERFTFKKIISNPAMADQEKYVHIRDMLKEQVK